MFVPLVCFISAVLTRLVLLLAAMVGDFIIPDHFPQGADEFLFEDQSQSILIAFQRWDSIHFFNIAGAKYQIDKQLVFPPVYPSFVHYISNYMPIDFSQSDRLTLSSLLINCICVSVSCYQLVFIMRKFGFASTNSDVYLLILIFCFCPASIFFLTAYTEALFSALTWSGLAIILSHNDAFKIGSSPYWGALEFLFSCLCLAIASSVRMNGSLNIIIIVTKYLLDPVQYKHNMYNTIVFEAARFLRYFMLFLSAILPGFYLESEIVRMACIEKTVISSDETLAFCATYSFPQLHTMYAELQRQYWNVGFLRYWQVKQIPNFLLAIPILFVSIHALTVKAVNPITYNRNSIASFLLEKALSPLFLSFGNSFPFQYYNKQKIMRKFVIDALQYLREELCSPQVVLKPHLLSLLVIGFFWANVQISTRLICAACPLVYLGFFDLLKNGDRIQRRLCIAYLVVYNVAGVLLHCNFFPWT